MMRRKASSHITKSHSLWPARVVQGFAKQLKKILRENGCQYVRPGKGDHEIWYSPVSGLHFTVDSKILSRHTANETLKQAGLNKRF